MNRKRTTHHYPLLVTLVLAALVIVPLPGWSQANLIPGASSHGFAAQANKGQGRRPGGKFAVAHRPHEVIVRLAPGAISKDITDRHDVIVKDRLEDNIFLLEIPASNSKSVRQMVDELKMNSNVLRANPNFLLSTPEVDSMDQRSMAFIDQRSMAFIDQRSMAFIDQRSMAFIDGQSPTDYFDQYAMQLVRVTEAQAIADGQGMTVAVIDTGVDTTHPVFTNVAGGIDYVDSDYDPSDECCGNAYGHGTMVAGVIALTAPGATILPVRAFNADGVGSEWDVMHAINYAKNFADIMNMSFGMPEESPLLDWAIDSAASQGVLLVASAGNSNTSVPQFPAEESDVMAVAVTDQNDSKASFSNYGTYVDVVAPGVSIYSAYPGGNWAWWDGTSFSAPFVSGVAALVISAGRGHGNSAGNMIKNTAVPVGSGLGRGRIDALAAVGGQ